MRKFITLFAVLFLIIQVNKAQNPGKSIDRLKVFIDCNSTWCDMSFIRTEINLVDFMLDRIASDVHVLVTDQNTGGGGSKYQLIFFGQNSFKNLKDTLYFNTDPNSTDFERRDQLVKFLQLGLAPFIAKTDQAKYAVINLKRAIPENKDNPAKKTKDPWNYWVFNIGVNGNLSEDENYKNHSLSVNFSSNRVTDKLKIGFSGWANQNQTVFEIDDGTGTQEKITVKNHDINAQHFMIASLGEHSSFGYQAGYSRSSFSNNKRRLTFNTGFEFSVFPYKEVNTKFWTFSWVADIRQNLYFDTTLYDKTEEILLGHEIKSNMSFNQKWGTLAIGASYHNYFHDWNLYRLSCNAEINIRITGGLSFNMYTYAELTRDQIFLPKGGATSQEVLTRRRQLASGYNIYSYFGLNYRFGSKLNNFVNPRFDD
jgi:hypothetical protein